MHSKTFLPTLFLIFLANCAWTQEPPPLTPAQVRDSIEILSSKIASDSLVESEYIGALGSLSAQYARFTQILAVASDTQLMDLTDHASPAVRLYAYYGLTWKNPQLLVEAFRNHLDDSARVKTINGCLLFESTVFVEAINWAEAHLVRGNPKGLSKEEKAFIHGQYMMILADQRERRQAEKREQ